MGRGGWTRPASPSSASGQSTTWAAGEGASRNPPAGPQATSRSTGRRCPRQCLPGACNQLCCSDFTRPELPALCFQPRFRRAINDTCQAELENHLPFLLSCGGPSHRARALRQHHWPWAAILSARHGQHLPGNVPFAYNHSTPASPALDIPVVQSRDGLGGGGGEVTWQRSLLVNDSTRVQAPQGSPEPGAGCLVPSTWPVKLLKRTAPVCPVDTLSLLLSCCVAATRGLIRPG